MMFATSSLFHRCWGIALTGSLSLAPVPTFAAGPAQPEPPASPDTPEPPAEPTPPAEPEVAPKAVSGTVALMRFSGVAPAQELRTNVQEELEERGLTVKGVALDVTTAAQKVKCEGFARAGRKRRRSKDKNEPVEQAAPEIPPECLGTLGTWLNKNPKTAADYIVYGHVMPKGEIKKVTLSSYDIENNEVVEAYDAAISNQDLILPLSLPRAVARDLAHHIVPPPEPTAEEQEALAQLDEPPKTPEELAEERRKIEEAETQAAQIDTDELDLSRISYDLKEDFDEFCRTGPRRKRESKDDPKDLRPKCSQGPFWGYWQPRAWVALGLTAGAAVTTVALYSVALVKRGPYMDAVDAVEDYEASLADDLDPTQDARARCNDDNSVCYADLATEVSETGAEMRTFALAGDAMLGVSALLAGVLGIIIWQDRSAAKQALTEEKRLRAITDIRIGPMLGRRGTQGAAFGFRF